MEREDKSCKLDVGEAATGEARGWTEAIFNGLTTERERKFPLSFPLEETDIKLN